MQKNRERTLIDEPAARTGVDRFHDRLLLGRETLHRDFG
jgi:hypothetical protein